MSRYFSSVKNKRFAHPVILASSLILLAFSAPPAAGEDAEQLLFGGPRQGDKAPEFILKDLQGRKVDLNAFKKRKPVILVTGSYTCPVFRDRMRALQLLYEKYRDRAVFYVLYTVEAHPKGSPSPYASEEWIPQENIHDGVIFRKPKSYEERVALAFRSQRDLHSSVPILVDGMDDAVWEEYGSAPNAAFLVGYDGTVVFRQDWFDPLGLERAVLKVFQDEPF